MGKKKKKDFLSFKQQTLVYFLTNVCESHTSWEAAHLVSPGESRLAHGS